MKKIVLSLIFASCALMSNAQTWIGGSLGFTYTTGENDTKSSNITFAPTIGYELSEKWELGLEFGYGRAHNKNTTFNTSHSNNGGIYTMKSESNSTSNALSVEPFVRYNFAKVGIVTFFVDGAIGYTYSKAKSEQTNTYGGASSIISSDISVTTYTSENDIHSVSVGLRPGVKFELNKHLELESHLGFLGYSHKGQKAKDAEEYSDSDTFGFNAGCSALNLGLIFKF